MLKTIVLIPTQNQCESIQPMIQATDGFKRLWVVDRCSDDTESVLTQLGETFIVNNCGAGFLAGKMRDLGLDVVFEEDYDVVVMLDGNRIPVGLTTKLVEEEMKTSDCSIAFCMDGDIRLIPRDQHHTDWWKCVATAGLFVKTKFLRRVRKLSFMHNRCFFPGFDGWYGEEDIFLGYCLHYVGANIARSKFQVTGRLPSSSSYNNMKNAALMSELIKKHFGGVTSGCKDCNIYI